MDKMKTAWFSRKTRLSISPFFLLYTASAIFNFLDFFSSLVTFKYKQRKTRIFLRRRTGSCNLSSVSSFEAHRLQNIISYLKEVVNKICRDLSSTGWYLCSSHPVGAAIFFRNFSIMVPFLFWPTWLW